MPRIGQQLSLLEPGQRQATGCVVARQEGSDSLCVFLREHRARRIQQFTTRRQLLPQRIQHSALGRCQSRDIAFAAQPFDVGVALDHAGGGAGRIEQNALEQPAVRPRRRDGAIGADDTRAKAEARQVVVDARHARRVAIQCRERAIGKFQNMPGLAARSGAGVEHPHPRLNVKQRSGELRTGVLH